MQKEGFWNDQKGSTAVVSRLKALRGILEPLQEFETELRDAEVLADLAAEEKDDDAAAEAEEQLDALRGRLEALETRMLLSGMDDHRNAYVNVQSGAGGTESCDWAQMLVRMYTRWAEGRGGAVKLVDSNAGEEAGEE